MKRFLLLMIILAGFIGLKAQPGATINFNAPCFGGNQVFSYDAGKSPDASGRNVYSFSSYEIAFNAGSNRWEMRADGGNFDVYFTNSFASSPNPPDNTTSTWIGTNAGGSGCTSITNVTGTGTQSTIGTDPCDGLGGDTDGDGACNDSDICPGFDDFADQDFDGIPDGCDSNPTVPDGVLVDASCLDPDPILFTLSGTDGTGRNVYNTVFFNGLEVRYNFVLGRWEVRASSGAMNVYLYNTFASWPDPPGSAGSWVGTSVLNCNNAPTPTINGSGTQNTLGCVISIGTPSVTQPPCGGDGVISVTASGARGSITYSLKQGLTTVSSNGSGVFVGLDAGTYTVVASDGAFPAGVCESQTSSILLTVQDNISPTASNPATVNVSCISEVPAANPAVVTDEADNCGVPTVSFFGQTDNGGIGNQADPLIINRTYRVTDAVGNFKDVYQTINVVDNTPPSLSCPPSSIFEPNDIGLCSAVVNYGTPTGEDNCGAVSVTLITGKVSGSTFPVGNTLVIYEAADAVGNTRTCSFLVWIYDRDDPVAVCKDITVNLGPGGVYNLTAAEIDAGSYDNCGSVTLEIPPTSFDCDDVGSTFPIVLTVTDGSGNVDVCTADVTVGDGNSHCNQAPTAVCQPITVAVDGTCTATITPEQVNNGSSDPDGDPITLSLDNEGPFSPGTYTVELTASDGSLDDKCTATVLVVDNIIPEITCPSNIVAANNTGICGAVVTYTPPVGIDNCSGPSTAQIGGLGSGATFPVGVTTEAYRVTDAAGNTKDCSFTVTVNDTELPAISCPANISVSNDPGQCGAVVDYVTPVGTDNCPGATTTRLFGLSSGAFFSVGVTAVKYEVSDVNGNKNTCEFIVTVNDTELPAISCPANISVSNDPGQCGATVDYVTPVGTDNCPGATTTRLFGLSSGALFPIGVTVVKYEASDVNGNKNTCEFIVTVTDDQDPVLICSGNIVQTNDPGLCGAVVNFNPPSAVDNCPGAVISRLSGINTGSLFPVGVTTQKYRVVDASGNIDECEFTITVTDDQDPVLICSGNIVQTNDPGLCGAVVNFNPPSAVDNCPGAVISRLSGINTGSFFSVGVTTQKYKVVDASGNTDECEFTITVTDDEAAVARCKSATITLDNAGIALLTPADIDDGSSDNCDVPSLSVDFSVFDCYELGDHIVTLTAEDSKGQSSTCTAVVTVEGEDADCDNVADLCDLCPGGDDRVDNNNDGSPDCIDFPGVNKLIEEWRCGNKGRKVTICHFPDGDYSKRNTLCISTKELAEHLAHGDYIGSCDNASCDGARQLAIQPVYDQIPTANLRLFPNPASGKVRIEMGLEPGQSGDQRLVIFNTVGQQVYSERVDGELSGGHQIDVSNLRSGIYYVQVRLDGRILDTRKLVVSR